MPAWATVAITLGASGITGAVGLFGASLQARRERRNEWRRELAQVADLFAVRFAEVIPKIRDGIGERAAGFDGGPMQGQAELLVDQLVQHAMRVQLYFGPGSPTESAAGAALVGLRKAVSEDVASANQRLEEAFQNQQVFMREAAQQIKRA